MASLHEIQAIVQRIHDDLPLLIERSKITPKQIVTVTGLSDISERLGLVQAGEFRAGNGKEPGHGFSGVRIGYPAFAYENDTWNIVGVNDDTLQVGIRSADGKLYFGAGTGILNANGIEIVATGLFDNDNGYKFVDADGEVAGGLYATVDGSDNTYIALRAPGQNGGATQVATMDAVASNTADARLTADSSLNAGAAAMVIVRQEATGQVIFQDIDTVDLQAAVTVNNDEADLDFRIAGLAEPNLVYVDASLPGVGIGRSDPAFMLDVFGDINADGWLYVNDLRFPLWLPFVVYNTLPTGMTTTGNIPFITTLDREYSLHQWVQDWFVAATNDGSNYWNISLLDSSGTTLNTISTAAGAANTWTQATDNTFVNATTGSAIYLYVTIAAVGTPGALSLTAPLVQVLF